MRLATLLLFICAFAQAQSGTYLGSTITKDYVGLSIQSEIDTSFLVMSLQTNLNHVDPTFKARLGFKIGKPRLHAVVFLPVFNLSLKEFAYNAPFNVELRWKPDVLDMKPILLVIGGEIYKDQVYPYITLGVPFK